MNGEDILTAHSSDSEGAGEGEGVLHEAALQQATISETPNSKQATPNTPYIQRQIVSQKCTSN